ncbi:STAS domain-containing protein [Sphingomonas sp. 2R-10]|uniref:STAS domain-containing protein n=1 Tax=Sphingomonas sp. 2R-10 TaxID=3045148 RepID=UPI000F7A3906|nr:STAS domain-containing protein [Sphingomonas sp. 2R-10]MDJ0276163.1 STAS domain-containing protein [Sphingomonas sp. 2R-10]
MPSTIFLPPDVTMESVGTVADALRDLPPDVDIVLDAAGLTAPDLSVVQLIESLRAEARLRGTAVRLATPADDTLTALLHRAGFTDAMTPDDNAFWFHGVPLQ